MDTSSDNPCVHVLWPKVYQSALPEAAFRAMSDVHECPVCTQSSLLAVQQRLPGCEVSHDLVVILSTDLTTFWANSSTSGSIKKCNNTACVFPATSWFPTTPMYSLVILVKNYLKWRAIQLASHQREHQLNYLV